ncbi:MAG: hypothetical protein AAB263_06610 [Planctomycetota bacterium]
MRVLLVLVVVTALIAVDEVPAPFTAQVLGPARANGLLRVVVQRSMEPGTDDVGPIRVAAQLMEHTTVLAMVEIELPRLSLLTDPVTLVLAPETVGEHPLHLVATVLRPGRQPGAAIRERVNAPVVSPNAALAAAAKAVAALRASGERDPLPWLWAEEATLLMADLPDIRNTAAMTAIAGQIAHWNRGKRPTRPSAGTTTLAIRDPIDDSVQPFRLHLPAGDGPFPVVLVADCGAPITRVTKVNWPALPESWLAAASMARIAVITCYPAGDAHWNGAAAARMRTTLAAACRVANLDRAHGAVICQKNPIDPPFPVHRPDAPTLASWWQTLPGPTVSARPPQQRDILAAFADQPFIVVVGTGEHHAATVANQRLAAAFQAAWLAHAHAHAPQVDDHTPLAALAGKNLVLIGNPRSNRVLAEFALRLPFAWDHRQVSSSDGFHAMRAQLPSIACTARLVDGHLALILDGSAPPWGDGLPLATLGTRYASPR